MSSELQAWVTLVRDGGLALAVVVLVLGGARGWYVFGRTYEEMKQALNEKYEEMRQDRDDWRTLALRGTSLAEKALETPPPPSHRR